MHDQMTPFKSEEQQLLRLPLDDDNASVQGLILLVMIHGSRP